jgi:hypothetical protein
MATAAAPRNDVYLSILAGRVLTALADLAADPAAWSGRIQKDLESGVEYCKAIRAHKPDVAGRQAQGREALRRLAPHDVEDAPQRHKPSDCDDVETFLQELLARSGNANRDELLSAIKFFAKDAGSLGS